MPSIKTEDILIYQYDEKNKKIGEYISFYDAATSNSSYGDYYKYNFCCNQDYKKQVRDTHFGVGVTGNSLCFNYSDMMNMNLNKMVQNFKKCGKALYISDEHSRNFTLNRTWEDYYSCKFEIEKWKSLSHDEFEKNIGMFLEENPQFVEVFDLNDYKGIEGIYLLILDKYNQSYFGQSNNIKRRIQAHWSKKKVGAMFDRFKAFDTTRIYVWSKESNSLSIDEMEICSIASMENQFLLNCYAGGFTPVMLDKTGTGKKYTIDSKIGLGLISIDELVTIYNPYYIDDLNDEVIR